MGLQLTDLHKVDVYRRMKKAAREGGSIRSSAFSSSLFRVRLR